MPNNNSRVTRNRKPLFAAMAIIGSVIMTLSGIELAARIYRGGVTREKQQEKSRNETAASRKVQAAKYVFYSSPWYFSNAVRGTDLFTLCGAFSEDYVFNARHNSSGFRSPEYTIAHPPATFRVLAIGDSFTWGQGVPTEQTYPRVLEELMKREGLKNGNLNFQEERKDEGCRLLNRVAESPLYQAQLERTLEGLSKNLCPPKPHFRMEAP